MPKQLIKTIEMTADFYHAMYLEPDDIWRQTQWLTSLDILERVQSLPEGSLLAEHLETCDHPELH